MTAVMALSLLAGGAVQAYALSAETVEPVSAVAEENCISSSWKRASDPALTEKVRKVFDKAFDGLEGVSYTPVALLASRTTGSGIQYRILCKATVVVPGAQEEYVVVTLQRGWLGKAEILDIPLHQLGSPNIPYHVVAIKRGTDTIIPRGDDTIKLNDIVYFTTTRKYIPYIRKIAGKEDYADVRNVMIMGGSRIAVRTAQYVPDYMQVKIVDNDLNRCNRLTELLDDRTMIINGDGRDMDLLIEEGLKNTEAFVALTGNSETNILACLAAKRMGVNKTVAEVENIDYIGMAESLDIGTVINKKMISASHIYQMMLDADVSNVKCLTFANADVAEFTVKADSKITKHLIKDLGLPKGTTIGGMIRNGEGILVTGDTLVRAGDHVVVFCLSMMIKKIEKYFN